MPHKIQVRLDEALSDFDEIIYLKHNHDVSLAVAEGIYPDGLTHFKRFGYKEGRIYKDKQSHFLKDYEALILKKISEHPNDIDLAMMQSIGSESREAFMAMGQRQVEILYQLGLDGGMILYDLGCGCGRTSEALIQKGWSGTYLGADVMPLFIRYAKDKSPTHHFFVHRDLSIKAEDNSLDRVVAWSVFTHLTDEEIYIYLKDILRTLKPSGQLVFSFLEHDIAKHEHLFIQRVEERRAQYHSDHLDNFLHRDFIRRWAKDLGFELEVRFLDLDEMRSIDQSVAVLSKP